MKKILFISARHSKMIDLIVRRQLEEFDRSDQMEFDEDGENVKRRPEYVAKKQFLESLSSMELREEVAVISTSSFLSQHTCGDGVIGRFGMTDVYEEDGHIYVSFDEFTYTSVHELVRVKEGFSSYARLWRKSRTQRGFGVGDFVGDAFIDGEFITLRDFFYQKHPECFEPLTIEDITSIPAYSLMREFAAV